MLHLTPTEQRIYDIIADGEPHRLRELVPCLQDSQATIKNVRAHLYNLKAKLRREGRDIWCVIHERTLHYRLAILPVKEANGV